MFMTLSVVIALVCTYVQTHQIVYIKYVQVFGIAIILNKAVKKKKNQLIKIKVTWSTGEKRFDLGQTSWKVENIRPSEASHELNRSVIYLH